MLSSHTPAQEHFQLRVCSTMGEGRESKGSLAVRNLILSSIVNTQLAAGQAFKVERSTGTCFRYIPSSWEVMGWKYKLQTAASTAELKLFSIWAVGWAMLACKSCQCDLPQDKQVRLVSSLPLDEWLLWLSGPICCPLKTGGRRVKHTELSPWSPLYSYMCYTWLVVKLISSENQFNFPIEHGFKIYPSKSNINKMAEDKRIKICI